MSLFGRKKKSVVVDLAADPERYRSVHVMQDDLDAADGKKRGIKKTVPAAVANAGLASDSPFLAASASAPESKESAKETRKTAPASSLKDLFSREKSPIVFDDESPEAASEDTGDDSVRKSADRHAEVHEVSGPSPSVAPGIFPAHGMTAGWGGSSNHAASTSAAPAPMTEAKPTGLPVWDAPAVPTEPELPDEPAEVSRPSETADTDVRSVVAPKTKREAPVSGSDEGKSPDVKPKDGKKKEAKKAESAWGDSGEKPPARFPMIPVVVAVGFLFVALGSFYVYVSGWEIPFVPDNSEMVEVTPEPDPVPEEPAELPGGEPDLQEPFSRENPNFLIIDTESDMATAEGVAMMLGSVEADVTSMNVTAPVEFVVRDSNNNPIAFSRFAYMLGLEFPSEMLAAFDEEFSLYVVPDGDRLRRGISVSIGDREAMLSMLASDEDLLLSSFDDLLYAVPVPGTVTSEFRDGAYGTLSTRYVNLDEDGTLSFDYVLLEDAMVIGTSKDSFRAVLGKMLRSM